MNASLNQIGFRKVLRPTREKYLPFFKNCFEEEYKELLKERTNDMLVGLEISQIDEILPGDNQSMLEAFNTNDQVVGTVVFSEVGSDVYVWGLYVKKSHQRISVGQHLMLEVCRAIKPSTILEVQVLKQSNKAINFYKKFGFEIYQTSHEEVFPSITLEVDFMRSSRDRCFEKLSHSGV